MNRVLKYALGCALAFSSFAQAMFTGPNANSPPLDETQTWVFDHHKTYAWRIDVPVPGDISITGASLMINNINDWRVEPGDIFYIRLLSNNDLQVIDPDYMNWQDGLYMGTDTKGSGDAFAELGILLDTYSDDDMGPNPPEDYVYNFDKAELALLNEYASKGVFGFGLDPDCCYFNNGIQFDIDVSNNTIPSPGALILAGIGWSVVGWLRRKRAL